MKLISILDTIYHNKHLALTESEDYRMDHQAPSQNGGYPMHKLDDVYPDIYTPQGVRYYGTEDPDMRGDNVVYQIQRVRNRPNAKVLMYRSVPDFNREVDKEIRNINKLLSYHHRYNFFPMTNAYTDDLYDTIKKQNTGISYDEVKTKMVDHLRDRIKELIKQRKVIRINKGDWVTTYKPYAVEHGKSHLDGKYKILQKTVKASELYTNGDSIFEWGYDP